MPYIGRNHTSGDHVNNFKVLDDISSYTATFDGTATSVVNTTNDTIRVPEHRFIQGQRVIYTNGGGGNIGGLTTGTAYFIIADTANTFKLATSASNATNSIAVNISSVGTGTSHTINASFDGINTRFKITHGNGVRGDINSATQLNIAINNVIQRPNINSASFTEGFSVEDQHKIVFKTAPTSNDIFWGNIIANNLSTFDVSDHKIDTFTGDGSSTEFNLSHVPANNESLMVTINGVLQHPSNATTSRAYSLIGSVLKFTAAPANGDEIQVRHLGFAGATTSDVTGFYGRTGNVVLGSSDNITVGNIKVGSGVTIESNGQATFVGVVTFGSGSTTIDNNVVNVGTALTLGHTQGLQFHTQNLHSAGFEVNQINSSGIITASSLDISGNASIGGVLTYEDVTNIDSVGIITARNGIHVSGIATLGSGGSGQAILEYQGTTRLKTQSWGQQTHGILQNFGDIETVKFDSTSSRNLIFKNDSGGLRKVLEIGHASSNSFITGHVGNISINAPTVSISTNFSVAGISTFAGNIILGDSIVHDGDTDTKIVFTENQIDLQTGGFSRIYVNNFAVYIRSGFPLGFLASSGPSASIKSGGTNNQDLLFTTGAGNPTRFQIGSDGASTFSGDVSLAQDLDVDGHTNLDNVSIAGVTTMTGDLIIPDAIKHTGDTDTKIRFPGTDTISFETAGSERLRVNSDRVIIGQSLSSNQPTYNPSTTFVTTHTNNPGAWNAIAIIGGHTTGASFLKFGDKDNEAVAQIGHYNADNSLRFLTNGNNERLRISSGGDVSIGSTANALRRVDVVGNSLLIRPNTALYGSAAGNATAVNNSIIIRMPYGENAATTSNAGARFGIQFTGSNNTTDHTSLNWADDPLKSASIYGVSEDVAGYNRKVGMAFYTSAFDVAQEERLRINSDGKIGIGAVVPKEKLHIHEGNIVIGQTSGSNTNIRNYIKFGRVGAPKAAIGFINNTGNGRGDIIFINSNVSNTSEFTNDDEVLRITKSGAVGIGTATVSSDKKLDVCDGIISVQAGHTHDTRIQFYRKNTGSLGWIGIPNWDSDGLYIYGPTSNSNEIAAKYSSGEWNFYTSGSSNSEKLRITSDGRLLLGTTTTTNNIRVGNKFGIVGTAAYTGMSISQYAGATGSHKPMIDFNRSRGTSDQSMTSVAVNDGLGEIIFRGSDGSNFEDGAAIRAWVDGTPSNDTTDMPGRLTFHTSADGDTSLHERLRIDSNGHLKLPNNAYIRLGDAQTSSGTLRIYSNGSQSYISPGITGNHIRFLSSGSTSQVELYFGTAQKLSTQSYGILVQGQVSGTSALTTNNAGEITIGTRARISAASGTCFILENSNSGGDERLRITSDGNVGIGTNNVSKRVQIGGISGSQFMVNPHAGGFDIGVTAGNLAPHYITDFVLYNGQIGSGTETFRVNSQGYVTKLKHPSFFAYMDGGDQTTNGGNTIPFDQTNTNIGGHFKTSGTDAHKFVVPVSGIYHFSGAVWMKNNSSAGNARWQIRKNNAVLCQAGWHQSNTNIFYDHSAPASLTVYCSAGDKIHAYADNTIMYWRGGGGHPHTYFSGHLVG